MPGDNPFNLPKPAGIPEVRFLTEEEIRNVGGDLQLLSFPTPPTPSTGAENPFQGLIGDLTRRVESFATTVQNGVGSLETQVADLAEQINAHVGFQENSNDVGEGSFPLWVSQFFFYSFSL